MGLLSPSPGLLKCPGRRIGDILQGRNITCSSEQISQSVYIHSIGPESTTFVAHGGKSPVSTRWAGFLNTEDIAFHNRRRHGSDASKMHQCRELIDRNRANVLLEGTVPKVLQISKNLAERGVILFAEFCAHNLLEVDCGVHTGTIGDPVEAGVDIFVPSSGIFQDSDYIKRINAMKTAWPPFPFNATQQERFHRWGNYSNGPSRS